MAQRPTLLSASSLARRLARERGALNDLMSLGMISFYDITEVQDPARRFVPYDHVDIYFEGQESWFLRIQSSSQWYPTVQPPRLSLLKFDGTPGPDFYETLDRTFKVEALFSDDQPWQLMLVGDILRVMEGLGARELPKFRSNCLRKRCRNVDARCNNDAAYDAVTRECVEPKYCWHDDASRRCYDIRGLYQAYKARPDDELVPERNANMPREMLDEIADPYNGVIE